MSNPDSILDSVKKVLGLDSTDTSFDLDVTLFINSAFGSLKQLGVGSDTGFIINDNTTVWSQYMTQLSYLGLVKSYIFMTVKLAFDPPDGRYALPAFQEQIRQLEWRINVEAEQESVDIVKAYFAPTVVSLVFASVVTPDASEGNVFYLTMTADCTISPPVNGVDGEHITLEIASNGFTATWGRGWDFGDAGNPVLSGSGVSDIISGYFKQSAASWRAGFTSGF